MKRTKDQSVVADPEPFCTLTSDELLTVQRHRDLLSLYVHTVDALKLAQGSYWKALREKYGFSVQIDFNMKTGDVFVKEEN